MEAMEPERFPIFERAVQQYREHGHLSQDVFGALSADERLAAFEEAARRDD